MLVYQRVTIILGLSPFLLVNRYSMYPKCVLPICPSYIRSPYVRQTNASVRFNHFSQPEKWVHVQHPKPRSCRSWVIHVRYSPRSVRFSDTWIQKWDKTSCEVTQLGEKNRCAEMDCCLNSYTFMDIIGVSFTTVVEEVIQLRCSHYVIKYLFFGTIKQLYVFLAIFFFKARFPFCAASLPL